MRYGGGGGIERRAATTTVILARPTESLRKQKRPKSSRLRALHFLVAGGCYDTVCALPVPLRLPVAGQVAA